LDVAKRNATKTRASALDVRPTDLPWPRCRHFCPRVC
jgi:hypothetical protein